MREIQNLNASGGKMSANPFSNEQRINFPEFSPVFKSSEKVTPEDNKKDEETFRWSIDQLAKLRPVDIGTSPASMAHTLSITSPFDNPKTQAETEKFFSQKCIHPSPWLMLKSQTKHVTFSPHPPTTAYFKHEDVIHNHKTDACTQTALTIPMDFDLEKLLGVGFYNGASEDSSFTLRRKLFGEPQRNSDDDLDEEEVEEGMDSFPVFHDSKRQSHDTQLSSTPLRCSSLFSDDLMHRNTGETTPPLVSSFVEEDNKVPLLLSPINKENKTPLKTPPTTDPLDLSPISDQKNNIDDQSPLTKTHYVKPILKRHFNGSPRCPEGKHYCNYRPEWNDNLSEEEDVPALISLGDLQSTDNMSDITGTSAACCTTYFNNMELVEHHERPMHSLVSSWKPPINSTMLDVQKKPLAQQPPGVSSVGAVDSGLADSKGQESHDTHMTSCDNHISSINENLTNTGSYSADSGILPQSSKDNEGPDFRDIPYMISSPKYPYTILPSHFKLAGSCPSHTTPPSRYNSSLGGGCDPVSRDIIRRKNILKVKLNVINTDKTQ